MSTNNENEPDNEGFDLDAWLSANLPDDVILPRSFISQSSSDHQGDESGGRAQEAAKVNAPIGAAYLSGEWIEVTRLDAISFRVRQIVVGVMRIISPEDYQQYKSMKFQGVSSGERPHLSQSRRAYGLLFKRFLETAYRHSGI